MSVQDYRFKVTKTFLPYFDLIDYDKKEVTIGSAFSHLDDETFINAVIRNMNHIAMHIVLSEEVDRLAAVLYDRIVDGGTCEVDEENNIISSIITDFENYLLP